MSIDSLSDEPIWDSLSSTSLVATRHEEPDESKSKKGKGYLSAVSRL